MFSALPPRPDIARHGRHVRFVPIADSCTAARGGSIDHLVGIGELLGQPRLPKTLSHQLRVRWPAPSDPSRYCKGWIDLKQTRRRLTRLRVASEMGESGRETVVS